MDETSRPGGGRSLPPNDVRRSVLACHFLTSIGLTLSPGRRQSAGEGWFLEGHVGWGDKEHLVAGRARARQEGWATVSLTVR
jgi:hypothetical protein